VIFNHTFPEQFPEHTATGLRNRGVDKQNSVFVVGADAAIISFQIIETENDFMVL
jgi:hypothetical protein